MCNGLTEDIHRSTMNGYGEGRIRDLSRVPLRLHSAELSLPERWELWRYRNRRNVVQMYESSQIESNLSSTELCAAQITTLNLSPEP